MDQRLTISPFPGRTCQGEGCTAAALFAWEDYSQRVRMGNFELLCAPCVEARFAVEYALAAAIDRAVRLAIEQRHTAAAEHHSVSRDIGETLMVIQELTGDAFDLVYSSIHATVRKAIRFAGSDLFFGSPEGAARERIEAAFLGPITARRCTGLSVLRAA